MARALAQDGVLFRDHAAAGLSLAEIVETSLRMSKLGLIDIFEQAALDEGVNLLVVVDQFEELFRYRQIVAAGRTDAQGISEDSRCVREPAAGSQGAGDLPDLRRPDDALGLSRRLRPVSRLGRGHQRGAVSGAANDPRRAPRRHRRPVGVGGAEIAPVLLTRLVNDVGDNPDQLSILQHALNRTWARWQHEGGGQGPLDLPHYEAIGTHGRMRWIVTPSRPMRN